MPFDLSQKNKFVPLHYDYAHGDACPVAASFAAYS